jgi:hypothetical protein
MTLTSTPRPPAYDASVRYEDPLIGRRWFASRERPHLVFGRRKDGQLEPVALTSGVKVCDFENSSVARLALDVKVILTPPCIFH